MFRYHDPQFQAYFSVGFLEESFPVQQRIVITSYSIHYTKLYDRTAGRMLSDRRQRGDELHAGFRRRYSDQYRPRHHPYVAHPAVLPSRLQVDDHRRAFDADVHHLDIPVHSDLRFLPSYNFV